MTNQEFYNLLDQAGHRLGNLAKSSAGYEFELRKLIEIVEGNCKRQDALNELTKISQDLGGY